MDLETENKQLRSKLQDALLKVERAYKVVHKPELFTTFLKDGMLVYDVGAHWGLQVQNFLDLNCRVLAIEPQLHDYLRLHRRYIGEGRVQCIRTAVGERIGTADMRVCSKGTHLSTLTSYWSTGRFSDHSWPVIETVPIVTLEHLFTWYPEPDYIKIDVEGYERQVLQGLHRTVPYLSFEWHYEFRNHALECLDQLVGIGYREFAMEEYEDTAWGDHTSVRRKLNETEEGAWGNIYARSA